MPPSTETEAVHQIISNATHNADSDLSTSFSGIAMASKAAQKLKRGKVPKSCRVSVMDEAKALGIFGFTSRRWLDYSSGLTPKEELDKAHFAKMTYIMKKKDTAVDNKENDEAKRVDSFRRKQLTAEDQIRQLHEAYQFLLKKYKLGEDAKATESLVSPFMKLEMDEKPVIMMKEEKEEESVPEISGIAMASKAAQKLKEIAKPKIEQPDKEAEEKPTVKEVIKVEENDAEKQEVNVENILDLVMGTEKKEKKETTDKNGSIKRNKSYTRTSSKKKKAKDAVEDLDLDIDPKSGSLKRKKSATRRSSRNKKSEN